MAAAAPQVPSFHVFGIGERSEGSIWTYRFE
jgi:hypothetical protein